LVAIYRPPKSTEFFGEFENLLNEIMDLPGKLLLCGDFNCRSYVTNVNIASQLKDILIEHDLVQHVTSPTHRLGGLLDLFITLNSESSLINAIDVRDMGFSDHCLVIATLRLQVPRIICSTSLRRNFRHLDEDRFRRLILASSVYENPKSNTNDFANQIIDDLVKVLDELVPLKKSTRRCGKQTRWLSAEAIVSRRARRRLERCYRRTKSEADRVAYRSACRLTKKLIIDSRKDYVRNRLADATGNQRQRWQIANELLHRNI